MDRWIDRWEGGGWMDRQRADFAHPRREIRHRSKNF